MSLKEDLTNQQIGKLKILKRAGTTKGRKVLWECQCECGQICLKTRDSLMRPSTRPKACSIRCSTAIPNGTQYGYLTILKPIFEEGQKTKYYCQCKCGNTIIVESDRLKRGNTKSCGCYRKERMSEIGKEFNPIKDLKGQRFGHLIALEPTEERKNKSVIWKCQCDCGNIYYVKSNHLQNNEILHCDKCASFCKGEYKIKTLLLENYIPFEREKTFDNCRFLDTNRPARFDFYVDNKYIIEYDGEQHFIATGYGWNTIEQLAKTKEHDVFKNKYCKDNNIPIIRIPYNKYNTLCIDDLKLETTKYLIN